MALVQIEDFENYYVSDVGEVSGPSGKKLQPAVNQQGIASVMLYDEAGKPNRRSVAVLVANAFVPRNPEEAFDTPTHIDGNKRNIRADNLMWRPRWFAIQYHKQFDPTGIRADWNNYPIYIPETGENFRYAIDCAMYYGILVKELVLAAMNSGTDAYAQPLCMPHWVERGTKGAT